MSRIGFHCRRVRATVPGVQSVTPLLWLRRFKCEIVAMVMHGYEAREVRLQNYVIISCHQDVAFLFAGHVIHSAEANRTMN